MSWRASWFGLPERINEIWNKFGGFSLFQDGFFFVFDDDFIIGDFDNFAARNGELGVEEAFNERAFDNDLLDGKIVRSDGEVDDFSELGAFFGFDFKAV